MCVEKDDQNNKIEIGWYSSIFHFTRNSTFRQSDSKRFKHTLTVSMAHKRHMISNRIRD